MPSYATRDSAFMYGERAVRWLALACGTCVEGDHSLPGTGKGTGGSDLLWGHTPRSGWGRGELSPSGHCCQLKLAAKAAVYRATRCGRRSSHGQKLRDTERTSPVQLLLGPL